MQRNKSQSGSAHVVVIAIVIAVLVGTLGFVFWNNFLRKEAPVVQMRDKPKAKEFCSGKENVAAENGTFCSKEVGVKFTVPSIFANKLAKADNYDVFEGSLDPATKKSAGTSESVYRATISGNDSFTFTVAQEPLRTGYVDVFDKLTGTYFNQATGELTHVTTPSSYYNSATGSYTTSGSYGKGEAVASFTVSGVRFFKGSSGDAGVSETTYFGVINNKIVKISLKNQGYMGDPAKDPTTIDASKVFDELDKSVKSIKVETKPEA